MTKEERTAIIRKIWMIRQSNLQRGDIIDHVSDPEFRKAIMEDMRKDEERIAELEAKLDGTRFVLVNGYYEIGGNE